ncbi:MAG TPA: helix-turn-helix transcriptional regulator [Mycobacterium sp.]|nr:helix-turn-helix transcriptional regulator [Mycobacterium sp.]
MTTSLPAAPPWTLGWRLRRSLEFAGVSREAMAQHLGVAVSTITRWTHDDFKRPPNRANLLAWAQITGVPLEWLEGDEASAPAPEPVTLSDKVADAGATTTASKRKPQTATRRRSKVHGTPSYLSDYENMNSGTTVPTADAHCAAAA